ncbi:hypothetical protein BVY04_03865 [bacterium M21]|nr:hypothetical protein BVY04_03865 [bacterium M21]
MRRFWIGMTALLVSTIGVQADDWKTWRGPTGDGISQETGWNPKAVGKLKIKWQKSLGNGYSAVSVADGKVYTMGNTNDQDTIFCLDARNGTELWKYTYACKAGKFKGPRSTPVLKGERVYSLSRGGDAVCVDAKTGKLVWMTNIMELGAEQLRWGLSSSALFYKEMVLFCGGKAGIALDALSGKKVWGAKGIGNYAVPRIMSHKGKDLALIWGADHIYGVDPVTGRELWKYEWKTKYDINAVDAIPVDGKVLISSGYDHGSAMLDISSGKPKKLWENKNLKAHFSTPIYLDGHLYGFDGNAGKGKEFACLEAKTGAIKWQAKLGFGSMTAADNKLIILTEKGKLIVAAAVSSGYQEIAAVQTALKKPCWTQPVLSNGVIYCRDGKGTLLAIDVAK